MTSMSRFDRLLQLLINTRYIEIRLGQLGRVTRCGFDALGFFISRPDAKRIG